MIDMKLRKLLSVLDGYDKVAIVDKQGLDLVCMVNKVPKDIKKRSVNTLHRASSDLPYDFLIVLKM